MGDEFLFIMLNEPTNTLVWPSSAHLRTAQAVINNAAGSG
jgi:hypothetical protein